MNFRYSQEPVAVYLEPNYSDGEQSVTLNGTTTVSKSSKPESKMDTLTTPQSGMMSQPSMADRGVEKWMSLLPDSHAPHFRLQGSKKAKQTTETSGLIPSGSFGKFDLDISFLRTYQTSLLTNTYIPYSESFPRAGMIVNGFAYEHPTLVPRMKGRGYGSWRTPASSDGEGGIMKMMAGKAGHYKLRDQVQPINEHAQPKSWPTPRANKPDGYPSDGYSPTLRKAVDIWPTPAACDRTGVTPGGHSGLAGGSGNRQKLYNILGKEEGKKMGSQALNPDWVEWLMGWPLFWTQLEPMDEEIYNDWTKKHGISQSAKNNETGLQMQWLWWYKDPATSSQGWEYLEQCHTKPDDSMPEVPHGDSREKRDMGEGQDSDTEALYSMQRDIPATKKQGDLMRQSEMSEGVGQNTCHEKMGFIPRISTGTINRLNRLKAVGNGQVPAVVATAWNLLTQATKGGGK